MRDEGLFRYALEVVFVFVIILFTFSIQLPFKTISLDTQTSKI